MVRHKVLIMQIDRDSFDKHSHTHTDRGAHMCTVEWAGFGYYSK